MPGSAKRVAATRAYWMVKTHCSSPSLTAPDDARFVPIDSESNVRYCPGERSPEFDQLPGHASARIAPCSDGASHLNASILMLIRI
jgi:hypothetical protein